MKEQLEALQQEALQKLMNVNEMKNLQDIRVAYLGKKGSITKVLKGMGKLSPEERPVIGEVANNVRNAITEAVEEKTAELEEIALNKQLEEETIDVTFLVESECGGPHLLTSIVEEIEDLFIGMGYEVKEGPEVETDYYNFEALNLPKDHPARDMQDSFYITNELLLRTHTSPVQARTMQAYKGEKTF